MSLDGGKPTDHQVGHCTDHRTQVHVPGAYRSEDSCTSHQDDSSQGAQRHSHSRKFSTLSMQRGPQNGRNHPDSDRTGHGEPEGCGTSPGVAPGPVFPGSFPRTTDDDGGRAPRVVVSQGRRGILQRQWTLDAGA